MAEFDHYLDRYSKEIEDKISIFGQKHDFFNRHKAELLLPRLKNINQDTAKLKVLDVGCGVGLVHPYIVPHIKELHGADVSGASIEIARKKNQMVKYATYDGVTLPYPSNTFDCAFAVCVLHHVPPNHWLNFICEMGRVVKDGGLVLFVEHNPFNPATRWVVGTCKFDANAVLVKPSTLRRLMIASGIGDTWLQYTLFAPFAGELFRKFDKLLAGVPFGAQYVMGGKTLGRGSTENNELASPTPAL